MRDLLDFLQDDDRLREERKKARKNKDKYIGMSGEAASYRYSEFPGGYFLRQIFSSKTKRNIGKVVTMGVLLDLNSFQDLKGP